MKKYECSFTGRKKTAIGITYPIVIIVEAEDEPGARLACYETHNHIHGGPDGIWVKEILPEPPAPEPSSGYTPCACRDCMDTVVSNDMGDPDMCSECEEAGCDRDGECLRADAYEE